MASAPSIKLSESVDFVRAVSPRRAFALHDCLLNDVGFRDTDANMAALCDCDYARLPAGTEIEAG